MGSIGNVLGPGDDDVCVTNHGAYLSADALVVLDNMLYKCLVVARRKLAAFTKNVVAAGRAGTVFHRGLGVNTEIRRHNVFKMFPVDVLSHDVVERVSEGAFLAEVHCFFHPVCHPGSIQTHFVLLCRQGCLRISVVLPGCGHVEYFNVRLQSPLVCGERAVGTVEENFTLKKLSVYIAEVILVA